MDFLEMRDVMRELGELGFAVGLSMWVDGAQHFVGNLRLLLDVYLYQENEKIVEKILKRHGLRLGACGISDALFMVVSSK